MSHSEQPIYSLESMRNMLVSSEIFIDETARIINQYQNKPMSNSKAVQEMADFPKRELVEDVFSRGTICVESAADHYMAYISTLKEPAKTLSPYTCIRSLLESSALALWLFEPDIDARVRVGRCFGFRYKEFTEQIKFFESDKVNSPDAQEQIDKVVKRIECVEKEAISLGYLPLAKNGKINGIATYMPETIGLIKKTLDKESEYRMLSGVAHCYLWASRQVGFKVIEVKDEFGHTFKALEKHVHPEMIVFGINLAVPTFAKVFWTMGKVFGWDIHAIESILSNTYDAIGFNDNLRFWYPGK